MKKIFLFIICLLFITSNSSFAFSQQELRDFETTLQNHKQTILRDFTKENKSLTQEELTKALSRTRSELLSLVRMERKFDVKTDNVCYSNGVIKQTTIISPDGSITYHYFNIYGIEVGSLTYKNNKLIASTRPVSDTESKKKIISTNSNTSSADRNYSSGSSAIGNGRISRIGNMSVSYDGSRISRIGNMSVSYDGSRISRIGNMSVSYDGSRISKIGNMSVSYDGSRISRIGNMSVSYDSGRMSSVGNMSISH